jgi:hypothetical protein
MEVTRSDPIRTYVRTYVFVRTVLYYENEMADGPSCRRPAWFLAVEAARGEPLKIQPHRERSTPMSYTKKRTKKIARLRPRPDIAKAQRPKTMSPLFVNAALASFALLGLAMAMTG